MQQLAHAVKSGPHRVRRHFPQRLRPASRARAMASVSSVMTRADKIAPLTFSTGLNSFDAVLSI
jgi:hypothetical protein